MKIETFKSALTLKWGVMVDGLTDLDVPEQDTERLAYHEAREAYPDEPCYTTSDAAHYSNRVD